MFLVPKLEHKIKIRSYSKLQYNLVIKFKK